MKVVVIRHAEGRARTRGRADFGLQSNELIEGSEYGKTEEKRWEMFRITDKEKNE
ncbi:MAG: hypothetical protein IKR23_01260 [Lachnospiraceae bacterium]|nr:hypothetical protein [Lachnospiraceae bacterium]